MDKTSNGKTVGLYSYELSQKKDDKINPIDLQREIHKGNESDDSYENQVRIAIMRGCQRYEGDFFVVVLFKKERLLQNVVRQYFIDRKSCPLPQYDQVVYRFDRNKGDISFIWVIPDKSSCSALLLNRHLVPLEEMHLLKYIDDFNSGDLDLLSTRINNEMFQSSEH